MYAGKREDFGIERRKNKTERKIKRRDVSSI